MASVSKDSAGNVRILFTDASRKRRAVYLGKVPKKIAESIKTKVEHLVSAAASRMPLDTETATWVAAVGDDLAGKLAAVGLIPPRTSSTLRAFLAEYQRGRATDGHTKPGTLTVLRGVANDLVAVLGAGADLRTLTAADAERVKQHYQDEKLAGSTISRRLKTAKMLFKHAVKVKMVGENPFADVKGKSNDQTARQFYVSADDTRRLIAAADPTWRVVLALARFGGLRCPSEVLSLRWENVNFETDRMTVTSPKTEHHPGKAYRTVPLFPEVRAALDEAFELAAPGEVYVVGGPQGERHRRAAQRPNGWSSARLRPAFLRLIRRAGLTPWPRLFQNLRSSCETDLMRHHPIHVVTAWIGNTPQVALGHYLQTLEADFAKAVRGDARGDAHTTQIPTQTTAAYDGPQRTEDAFCPTELGDLSAVDPTGPMQSGGRSGHRMIIPGAEIVQKFSQFGHPAAGDDAHSDVTGDKPGLSSLVAALTTEQRAELLALLTAKPDTS